MSTPPTTMEVAGRTTGMVETVLVTGCSSGIGRETALAFLETGWEVYATARDTRDVVDLAERGCQTAELDVTDDAAVGAVVERIHEEQESLDCLVNNAGYGQFGAVEDVPLAKVRQQFEVNTFGPLRLVQAVLPQMRERGDGTIVNVTAGVGTLTLPGIGVYTGSKFALESITDALRQEVAEFGVDVVAVEPGLVATAFYDRATDEVGAIDQTDVYANLYRVLESIRAIEAGGPGINTPRQVAETVLQAARADRPDPMYRVGPVATAGTYAGGLVRGRARDAASQLALEAAASDWVQRYLERRAETASREE